MHVSVSCSARLAAWTQSAPNNTPLFISEFIPVISAEGRGLSLSRSLSPSCIINTPLQLVDWHSGGLWHVDGPLSRQN